MTTLQRVANAQGLWDILLPNLAKPEPRQFMLWTMRFTDQQIERALIRASRKFAGQSSEQNPDAGRYVTGVLLHLEQEQKNHAYGCESSASSTPSPARSVAVSQ